MDRREYIKKTGLMIGGVMFPVSMISFMQSCKAESKADWKPLFFNINEIELIASLADVIIPRSDSPGASDVMVERRIDEAVFHNYEYAEQRMFIQGLKHINSVSHKLNNKEFTKGTIDEKHAVMNFLVMEARENKTQFQKPIYPLLKGLVILSYFSNEIVNNEVLKYDPVPGEFNGDIAYGDVGAIWSLE